MNLLIWLRRRLRHASYLRRDRRWRRDQARYRAEADRFARELAKEASEASAARRGGVD